MFSICRNAASGFSFVQSGTISPLSMIVRAKTPRSPEFSIARIVSKAQSELGFKKLCSQMVVTPLRSASTHPSKLPA